MAERQTRENYIADLRRDQMANFVRMLFRMSQEQAYGVSVSTLAQLERLGAKRDTTKAARNNFTGTVNIDSGAILEWASRIRPEHKRAIRQLVLLDATAVARSGR